VPSTKVNGPLRPSSARFASIASAAASPTAIPSAFAGPSAMAASEVS